MTTITIKQYNLLSSALSPTSHYPFCRPEDLKPKTRLSRHLARFSQEIEKSAEKSAKKPIYCLQEVSQTWTGRLHTFFENHDYFFTFLLAGSKRTDYMGIAIAYPRSEYELTAANYIQLTDLIPSPSKSIPPEKPFDAQAKADSQDKTEAHKEEEKAPEEDQWAAARAKSCPMILLNLHPKNTHISKEFAVANIHMPCRFLMPTLMIIDMSVALQKAQKLAGSRPLIFAGDWNTKPTDPGYHLALTGILPSGFQLQVSPTSVEDKAIWSPDLNKPMKSAYVMILGQEPAFTNYAKSEWDDEPFIGTLDYIFFSPHPQLEVLSVDNLPTGSPTEIYPNPLPTETEPSDHLELGATFIFT